MLIEPQTWQKTCGNVRPQLAQSLDSKLRHLAKVAFGSGPDEHAKAELLGSRRDRNVVGRDQAPALAEDGEQIRPSRRDRLAEFNNPDRARERIDLGTAASRTFAASGECYAHQQLRIDDCREGYRLGTEGSEPLLPVCAEPLEGDERARVDYESHGLRGGRSAFAARSRSAGKPASAGADDQAAAASKSVAFMAPATGPI
mgnify:CR=1 FL=1